MSEWVASLWITSRNAHWYFHSERYRGIVVGMGEQEQDRIAWKCPVCGDEIEAPNKGMGRVLLNSFKWQHQDCKRVRND